MNASHPSRKACSNSPSLVTRRRFLGATMAATSSVAALSLPESIMPQAGAQVPPEEFKRKIKLGVVGCGGRGAWIANLFRKHEGYQLHAVADYFPEVANQVGEALGVDPSRRFSTLSGYKRVIESGIEAIALETPPYFFPEHAQAAVQAGLHVYMAKPVAVDVPGCLSIEASARKATAQGQVFFVDYQIPTDPKNREVIELIRAGEIGKVMALNSHYFAGQFPDPHFTALLDSRFRNLIWCNDNAMGGGYHVNACIHAVDAALWIAGERPLSALGLSRIGRPDPHGDSHDIFELLFEFENGLVMSHRGKHINNLLGFDVICQILGSSGHAQITYGGKAFLQGKENGCSGEVQNLYEAGAVRNIATFYQCLVERNTTNETVRRSVDGALTTMLGREAGLRRQRISLNELLQANKRLEVDLKGLKT